MAAITKAGESLIAQKQAAGEVLEVGRFVLALVPGLDPQSPVDRDAPMPPVEQIVFTAAYTQKGFINPSQVVYSLMMGSDIGDFDWNWMGLETAEGVLLSVGYVPVQEKRKNIPPHQIGNNVTRNMMLVFDGAQALSAITVDASTWQHDFTVRLAGIDGRERLSNRDLYGRACFFGSSLQLEKVGDAYQLAAGTAYVEGIQITLANTMPVVPTSFPTTAWLDIALVRHLNTASSEIGVGSRVEWGDDLPDYIDSAGVQHYCVPIADLPDVNNVTDRRPVEPIDGPLVTHFAARTGTYPQFRAQATTKGDVGLDQIPNAKSDDPASNSSEILATTAALNNLNQQIGDSLTGMVCAFAMATAPTGWIKCDGTHLSRAYYSGLFARIGTTFGVGDGETTFQVPDLRGVFLRALDDGSGRDPDRALGSYQEGQNLWHTHSAASGAAGSHGHTGGTDPGGVHSHYAETVEAGYHQHTIPKAASGNNTTGPYVSPANAGSTSSVTDPGGSHVHGVNIAHDGNHIHGVTVYVEGDHIHTVTVDATGGSESRPSNIALLYCIKY